MTWTRALFLCLVLADCGGEGDTMLQGYVEGEYLRVASPISGQLTSLVVARGVTVRRGDPLFALEHDSETAAVRQAEGQVGQAEAQHRNLLTGKRQEEIDAIRAQLAQAEAGLLLSESNLLRQEALVRDRFVSREAGDTARMARDRDRARVTELRAQLATATLSARPDEIRAAQAATKVARETLVQAQWRLDQKTLQAPQDARVVDTLYVQGEWVSAGSPVVTLLPPANIKVRFFVPERLLGSITMGQGVSISCDACGEPIPAPITFIAPQAEYTPPVIYSRESRSKLVFLLEARPTPANAVKLHPGQPVEVRLR